MLDQSLKLVHKYEILQSQYDKWESYQQRQSNTSLGNEDVLTTCPHFRWALEVLWANDGIRNAIETGQEAPLNENVD